MAEARLEAVIWDMDGVIVDSGPYHFKSWQYVFHKRGARFSESDFRSVFGQRNDTIIGKTLSDISPEEVRIVAAEKEDKFREVVAGHVRAFPGVMGLITSLHEHDIKLAIASSAPPENIRLITGSLGIADRFQAVVWGREVPEGKPSPLIFLLAAQRLLVTPSGCVVIEDSIAGVEAAGRAGMKCVAVTNTNSREKLARADLLVDSLEDLSFTTLAGLWKKENG